MGVSVAKYRPLLFSERVNTRDIDGDGDQDLTLCRASCTAMGFDATTLGEWTTNGNGTRWGKGKVGMALERMRRATGEPSRPGYNTSHTDDFLRGIKAPADAGEVFIEPFERILNSLRRKYVISMSGNTGLTPAGSPLRKYVNPVPHEMLFTRLSTDEKSVAFIDPMTPHGTSRYERWAPVEDMRKFGSAFKDDEGKYITVRFKRGRYTEAQEVARDRATVILKLQRDMMSLQAEWERQQKELIAQDVSIEKLEAEVSRLKAELESCGDGPDVALLEDELDNIEAAIARARNLLA